MNITIRQESITRPEVDAIVNPANSFGFMGGGVSRALKDLGGEVIEEEAINHAPIEVGDAISTTAGTLKCKYVIHSPTMREPAEKTDSWCIGQAMRAALEKADQLGCEKIAFPGMGTGIGQVSQEDSAKCMLEILKDYQATSIKEVFLVDVDEKMVNAWKSIIGD